MANNKEGLSSLDKLETIVRIMEMIHYNEINIDEFLKRTKIYYDFAINNLNCKQLKGEQINVSD